jgi:competence protein ComEC
VTHDGNPPQPAAALLIAFVAGLLAAKIVVSPLLTAAGGAAVALLAFSMRRRTSARAALLALAFAAGVAREGEIGRRGALDAEFAASLAADRFVTVEVSMDRGWRRARKGGEFLLAPEFLVQQDGRSRRIARRIVVYASFDPPCSGSSLLVAEGHLRRTRDVWRLTVKSPLLASCRGEASRWSPRTLNRRMAAALAAAADSPRRREGAALASALVLGDGSSLDEELRENFRRGGTFHLLVFSGMQIAVAAAAIAFLLSFLRSPRIVDATLLAVAAVAPLFAGNDASVVRASWMIGLYAASRLAGRPTPTENLLFVSALLRLIAWPAELTDPSFALSYAATGGLIFIGKPLARRFGRRWWSQPLGAAAGAELATTPLTLYFFHQTVIGSGLVTIVVSPLLSAMLALSAAASLAALASPSAAARLLDVIALLNVPATSINAHAAGTLGLFVAAAAPPAALVSMAYLGATLVSRRSRVALAAALLFPAVLTLWQARGNTAVRHPTVELLDLPAGEGTLLRNGRRAVLIDGGEGESLWQRDQIVPRLLDRGIRRLDVAIVSHPHPDHSNGIYAVLRDLEVGELWLSPRHMKYKTMHRIVDEAERRGTRVRLVRHLERREAAGLHFTAHVPRLRFKRAEENNSSVVWRVQIEGRKLLFTGDAEADAERLLVWDDEDLAADVLKVAHHGSRTSTTPLLLEAVRPRVSLISANRGNSHGHPHGEVVERLSEQNVRIYRTDLSGDIRIVFWNGHLFMRQQVDTPRGTGLR